MILHCVVFFFLLVAAVLFSILRHKLTPAGAITGGMLAVFIFLGTGFTGIALLGSFFLLGIVATSWQMQSKVRDGIAVPGSSTRTATQVLANGGVAGAMGLLAWVYPTSQHFFLLLLAASLSSATADTLSSELGGVYGSRFYNITGFQPGIKGENGVVSLEGTLFGVAGSIVIACIYAIGSEWSTRFMLVIIAGTAGNLADSILGATLERRQLISNDTVNLLNTGIAALIAFLLVKLF